MKIKYSVVGLLFSLLLAGIFTGIISSIARQDWVWLFINLSLLMSIFIIPQALKMAKMEEVKDKLNNLFKNTG